MTSLRQENSIRIGNRASVTKPFRFATRSGPSAQDVAALAISFARLSFASFGSDFVSDTS